MRGHQLQYPIEKQRPNMRKKKEREKFDSNRFILRIIGVSPSIPTPVTVGTPTSIVWRGSAGIGDCHDIDVIG